MLSMTLDSLASPSWTCTAVAKLLMLLAGFIGAGNQHQSALKEMLVRSAIEVSGVPAVITAANKLGWFSSQVRVKAIASCRPEESSGV
jgi:hypothetical protein